MKLAYFNNEGRFWCWAEDQTPGPDDINISAEIDENMALWRQVYNLETETVDVYHPEMTEAEAEAENQKDLEAIMAAHHANSAAAAAADDSSSLYNQPQASE